MRFVTDRATMKSVKSATAEPAQRPAAGGIVTRRSNVCRYSALLAPRRRRADTRRKPQRHSPAGS